MGHPSYCVWSYDWLGMGSISGDWIEKGGVLGAAIGFAIGGIMIFFVGLTYAELTAAMPQCGGEHVFSYKAMGPIGSFICTWAIISWLCQCCLF